MSFEQRTNIYNDVLTKSFKKKLYVVAVKNSFYRTQFLPLQILKQSS